MLEHRPDERDSPARPVRIRCRLTAGAPGELAVWPIADGGVGMVAVRCHLPRGGVWLDRDQFISLVAGLVAMLPVVTPGTGAGGRDAR